MQRFVLSLPKSRCQKVRDFLRQEKLLDKGTVEKIDSSVGIPVLCENKEKLLLLMKNHFDIDSKDVEVRERPCSSRSPSKISKIHQDLQSSCKEVLCKNTCWSDELQSEIPRHWEKHEDLILFPETAFKSNVWKNSSIGLELWSKICRILGVSRIARKKSTIENNDFRSPKVELLFGFQDCTWVRRKENGIIFSWDIQRSMFSVGNITEKMRISSFDCTQEVIVDLFAGIGYFTLPYLVHAGAAHVHACEWNPGAVLALKRNLKENQVEGRCSVYEGDNRSVCPRNVADRVNLGLLPNARISYETACLALKSALGGILHIHGNVRTEKFPPDAISYFHPWTIGPSFECKNSWWKAWCFETAQEVLEILARVYEEKWHLTLEHLVCVKSFAPHVDHLVLDLHCRPTSC